MTSRIPGRHRALRSRRRDALTRSSAVIAASGGLIAAVTGPASAVPAADAVAAPQAPVQATTIVVSAPALSGPVKTTYGVVGVKAVAKPKPKPKPVPVVVAPAPVVTSAVASTTTTAPVRTQAASRSTTRTAPATQTQTQTPAPTPTPTPPAPPSAPPASGVLGIAASLSGIPYVYGGSTPAGFDCSGFTMYVFGQAGISLPRTAAAQQSAATPVSNPQPGDLVFFGYPAYHVGIYAGNGMMYDSPRTGLSTGLRAIWSSSVTYGRP